MSKTTAAGVLAMVTSGSSPSASPGRIVAIHGIADLLHWRLLAADLEGGKMLRPPSRQPAAGCNAERERRSNPRPDR
jgi:hypothetical protein